MFLYLVVVCRKYVKFARLNSIYYNMTNEEIGEEYMYNGSNTKLNELVKYIEKNLTEKIDYKILSRILAVNEYTLHRVFLFVTNMSISEYIRKRRMSMAAIDLMNTNLRIIDVAVKYQYDSATSFARAFKKMMGFNPKDIIKNKNFVKIFPVLNFEDDYNNFVDIEYKEIKNFSISLYAVSQKMRMFEIPKLSPIFWKNVEDESPKAFKEVEYGILEYENSLANDLYEATYYVASKTEFKNSKKLEINNKNYLVFKLPSNEPKDISSFTKKIYNSVILELGYNIDETAFDIEEYTKDGIYIYIAVK